MEGFQIPNWMKIDRNRKFKESEKFEEADYEISSKSVDALVQLKFGKTERL